MSEPKKSSRLRGLARQHARRVRYPDFANEREVIRPSVGGIVRARTRDLVSQSNWR
jgi:hypothetical protein